MGSKSATKDEAGLEALDSRPRAHTAAAPSPSSAAAQFPRPLVDAPRQGQGYSVHPEPEVHPEGPEPEVSIGEPARGMRLERWGACEGAATWAGERSHWRGLVPLHSSLVAFRAFPRCFSEAPAWRPCGGKLTELL